MADTTENVPSAYQITLCDLFVCNVCMCAHASGNHNYVIEPLLYVKRCIYIDDNYIDCACYSLYL